MGKTRDGIRRLYREERKAYQGMGSRGEMFESRQRADTALTTARIKHSWEILESLGLVRLVWQHDECVDFDDLCGDVYSPEHNQEIAPERLARERRDFAELCSREGVWLLVGQYRGDVQEWKEALDTGYTTYGSEVWETGDCIGGLVGQGESGYEADIMQATIDALREHLRARCGSCRR